MLTEKDQESLLKAAQTAALLLSDLEALHAADNPLLAELARSPLEDASALKVKLERVLSLTE